MLHIHNGDSTANTARHATIPGAHLAFREALIGGPTPANLNEVEWRKLRGAHLAAAYGVPWEEAERDLERLQAALASFHLHDEVVLWFEHDLFCQVNLIYLLDWFAARELGSTRLSLVCVGEFPGKPDFSGLGELNESELASLLDLRHEVTETELQTATAAWSAYCAPEPLALELFLNDDTSSLPYLRPALLSHLARFPSVQNGLGRIEQRGLALIEEGFTKFTDLFSRFREWEPVYGLGDAQLYLALQQLRLARTPLLRSGRDRNRQEGLNSGKMASSAFEITAKGKSVLRGEADYVSLNGIDAWLGGVHLTDSNLWRWDEARQHVISEM